MEKIVCTCSYGCDCAIRAAIERAINDSDPFATVGAQRSPRVLVVGDVPPRFDLCLPDSLDVPPLPERRRPPIRSVLTLAATVAAVSMLAQPKFGDARACAGPSARWARLGSRWLVTRRCD